MKVTTEHNIKVLTYSLNRFAAKGLLRSWALRYTNGAQRRPLFAVTNRHGELRIMTTAEARGFVFGVTSVQDYV